MFLFSAKPSVNLKMSYPYPIFAKRALIRGAYFISFFHRFVDKVKGLMKLLDVCGGAFEASVYQYEADFREEILWTPIRTI